VSAARPTFFATHADFGRWLAKHGASTPELLVGFRKVHTGQPSMTWSESVDEALCHGWIDGVRKRIDDDAYTIRFTPRRATSVWSAINIAKVHALEAEGRMTDAGRKAFALRSEARSGIYAYEQPDVATLDAAETRVFKRSKDAWKFWEASPPGYRKTLLRWVTTAKKAETRATRLQRLIDACAAGIRLR
jgi:uncharacterized protein YdeI (YjbR/CyaY-like superfamily)